MIHESMIQSIKGESQFLSKYKLMEERQEKRSEGDLEYWK